MKIRNALLLAAAALSVAACGQVDAGHTGVFSRYGAVEDKPVREGLHWYNPFTTDLIVLNTQIQKAEGETATYTRDSQQAGITYTITYALSGNAAPKVYRTVGEDWFNRLAPQVIVQSIKDEFGKWNAVDIINRREEVQRNIQNRIVPALRKRNIAVSGFELTDVSYSKAFEDAVEAKQVAVETANAERNRTVQVEEQAKQKVIAAEGEAKAIQLRAQALSQNQNLVQYEAVRKWDGKLPANMYGGSAVPFVDVTRK